MKLAYRLSTKSSIINGIEVYEVMARLHSGSIDQYAKTGVLCPARYTDSNGNTKITWRNGVVVPRISFANKQEVALKQMLDEAKRKLFDLDAKVEKELSALLQQGIQPKRGWLQGVISGKPQTNDDSLCSIYKSYINDSRLNVTESSRRQYLSVLHNLQRYEKERNTILYLDKLTPTILQDIEQYLINDLGNSKNTALRRLKHIRSFVRWANGLSRKFPITPLTTNNPFTHFSIEQETYGTPFYLTIAERNRLAEFDLPSRLAQQRDIFIFHCLIGCRIGDLWSMTKDNIIDGAVEYIPRKTKEGRPVTIRVPLNSKAQAIVDRYKDNGDSRLFPFVAQQQYNEDIKEMLRLAGITRMVTILNPKTRREEKQPICEVASSHMARRTFIGNLYKQVKDPNLVGKLSGHKEGSKAFARYRDIDDDIAKELVEMLE